MCHHKSNQSRVEKVVIKRIKINKEGKGSETHSVSRISPVAI
jgi:hypothetical protein